MTGNEKITSIGARNGRRVQLYKKRTRGRQHRIQGASPLQVLSPQQSYSVSLTSPNHPRAAVPPYSLTRYPWRQLFRCVFIASFRVTVFPQLQRETGGALCAFVVVLCLLRSFSELKATIRLRDHEHSSHVHWQSVRGP